MRLERSLAAKVDALIAGYLDHFGEAQTYGVLPDKHVYQGYLARVLLDHYARVVSTFTGKPLVPGEPLTSITARAHELGELASDQAVRILLTIDQDILHALHGAKAATNTIEFKGKAKDRFSAVLTLALRTVRQGLKKRLPMIANVNTNGVAEGARAEAARVGSNALLYKRWVTKGDERVRAAHVAMHGMMERVENPFDVSGYAMMQPGDASGGAPLNLLANCFPADTLVSAAPFRATRHWYEGPLIIVKTVGGAELSATPNHPVLTPEGWVALGSLKKDDNVVRCAGLDQAGLCAPNVKNVQATIDQVFNALAVKGRSNWVRSANVNFHGDRPAQDINVVTAERELREARNASLSEHVDHFGLARADIAQTSLLRYCLSGHLHVRCWHTASGLVRRLGERLAFFVRCVGHALAHRVASVSPAFSGVGKCGIHKHAVFADLPGDCLDRLPFVHAAQNIGKCLGTMLCFAKASRLALGSRNASKFHVPVDSADGGTKLCADLLNRCAGKVHLDPVVDVGSRVFTGHVYNLETVHGFYTANGIIAQNCRCWLEYYQRSDDGAVPEEQGTYDQIPLQTPSLPTRTPRKPGAPLGSNIPNNPTSAITFTGRPTRARIVLGNGESATATVGDGAFTVRVNRRVIAQAQLGRRSDGTFDIGTINIDPDYRLSGVEQMIRNSVLQTNDLVRRTAP